MISKKIIGIVSVLAVIAVVFAGSAAAVSTIQESNSNILVSDLSQNLDASTASLLLTNADGSTAVFKIAGTSSLLPYNASMTNGTGYFLAPASLIADAATLKADTTSKLAAVTCAQNLNKTLTVSDAVTLSRLNSAALQSGNINFANLQSTVDNSSLLARLLNNANTKCVIVCPVSDLNNHLINLAGLNNVLAIIPATQLINLNDVSDLEFLNANNAVTLKSTLSEDLSRIIETLPVNADTEVSKNVSSSLAADHNNMITANKNAAQSEAAQLSSATGGIVIKETSNLEKAIAEDAFDGKVKAAVKDGRLSAASGSMIDGMLMGETQLCVEEGFINRMIPDFSLAREAGKIIA